MQQVDDPPSLPVGTEVSAKYKGAFCEAKVSKVVRNIKVKVAYKHGLGSGIVSDDIIKVGLGQLRVGSTVEVRHLERKELVEATVTKIQDCSQYTVVFDDGDITTLRRTALCLKSGRHFNESETLDQLPLTHPEHFGNPVVGGRRGRRRGHLNEDSSEEEDESDVKEVVSEKEEHIGKVVCVETESKKKDKEKWFPGLVVAPTAQATVRIRVKDEYLVRSFKDGRYYTVPKKEATEFTREAAAKQESPAVQAALEFLDGNVLPPHWDRDALFGLSNSSSEDDGEIDSDSSDDEPREEKDRFVAQLYKYMDDRGTPLNKVPSIQNRDVDLYRLFRAVQKRGGYNRVTAQNQWKSIAMRLNFTPVTVSVTNLVKQAFKKFLQPYGEFHRKLGCSMLMTPRNSNRSKGRSLVRANSVASPKPVDNKESAKNATSTSIAPSTAPAQPPVTAPPAPPTVINVNTQSAAEESENTSESSLDIKNKRKGSVGSGKVKGLVEKFEEKTNKDEADMPLSKIKAAAATTRNDEKEKEKEAPIKEAPNLSVQLNRESSPVGTTKKERNQKKLPASGEDKRGKRKKEESILDKIDIGDFVIEIGDKLKVYYHEKKVTYEAKVIEIAVQRGTAMYLVHYTGWNNRYDEWVPRERIAENLTKGSKQKGRGAHLSGNMSEKPKENPPKPPSAALANAASVSSTSMMSNSTSTKVATTSAKRGRGRSDSLPPRSTTPSSVASNSSRTKSPAASNLKKRPTRTLQNSNRRTSTNISDVSMPSESETDSDEPVRRPTRASKESPYKTTGSAIKSQSKNKASASAANSRSDTEDEEIESGPSSGVGTVIGSSSNAGTKGRDYDLNQIRSELKGFQGLKSPSPTGDDSALLDPKGTTINKVAAEYEFKTSVCNTAIKDEIKVEIKEEPTKSSCTDLSSETDSFGDDDSQSSDKTTTLENMTKKFQQKIDADKQRALEKQPMGKTVAERVPLSKTRIVEKIIKDSLAEKRQESLKAKPTVKEEADAVKTDPENGGDTIKGLTDVGRKVPLENLDDDKKVNSKAADIKTGLIAPARFNVNANASKYNPNIVEKPLSTAKKNEVPNNKKNDVIKGDITLTHSKKFIEPGHKEIIKIEPPAACSPSSSSSSSSSSASSTSTSSRSLPDMSKLDISGSSSSFSSFVTVSKESKFVPTVNKSISPDIYEFKDPEPFEFEIRKSPMVSNTNLGSSTSTITSTSSNNVQSTPRKLGQKPFIQQNIDHQSHQIPTTTLTGRKKRSSPMKDSIIEKKTKFEEKHTQQIVADAKLSHVANSATSIIVKPPINQSKSTHSNMPASTSNSSTIISTNPTSTNYSAPQKVDTTLHVPFDTLRKSPSFNLNINALNEELAQTVQETTRVLTDVLQTTKVPSVSETTPTKIDIPVSSPKKNVTAAVPSKTSTPTNNATTIQKTTAGSPFIETRRDLSNVFELSSSEGSASNSESKDNKFELENAKILLSATGGAFCLEHTKYENKPTSIADKVLKAISQKKEEVENKNKETKVELEKEKSDEASNKIELNNTTSTNIGLLKEPIKINTDLPPSSTSLLSGGKKDNLITIETMLPNLTRRTPLTSPEPKLGILESITIKNNDLSETIQKLECAIQRKTPVNNVSMATTTPTSTVAPNTFSDDSMDSTDSERRLVIEDVIEESSEIQKSPNIHQSESKSSTINMPVRIEAAPTKVLTTGISVASQVGIQTPIPLKIISPDKSHITRIPSDSLSANVIGKLQGNTAIILTTKPSHIVQQSTVAEISPLQQQKSQGISAQMTSNQVTHIPTSTNDSKNESNIKSTTIQSSDPSTKTAHVKGQSHQSTNVVPIIVPDIPASVVVASTAVPSVVAAAQAAAAALQNPVTSVQRQSQLTITGAVTVTPVTTSFGTAPVVLQSFENVSGICSTPASNTNLPFISLSHETSAFTQTGASGRSGFYLEPNGDINTEDAVQSITDHHKSHAGNTKIVISKDVEIRNEELPGNTVMVTEVHNEAINLLCEETIPGSPAPICVGKEESLLSTQRSNLNIYEIEKMDFVTQKTTPCFPHTSIPPTGSSSGLHAAVNSSPNDSASQDDSSEELKKCADVENEVSPRKRRRTRKQSEMLSMGDQPTKRRRTLTCAKKNLAGSDSDENSDTLCQRSSNIARQQQQQQHLQQIQQQSNALGLRPCPYNFLVQLDPVNTEQNIALIQKRMQEIRQTFHALKADLATIDRRRKKLRRREREKKQQNQNQQQSIKLAS